MLTASALSCDSLIPRRSTSGISSSFAATCGCSTVALALRWVTLTLVVGEDSGDGAAIAVVELDGLVGRLACSLALSCIARTTLGDTNSITRGSVFHWHSHCQCGGLEVWDVAVRGKCHLTSGRVDEVRCVTGKLPSEPPTLLLAAGSDR